MLTEIGIKNAKVKEKQYKMSDSQGMFLLVHPKGGKYWRLKYRFNDKEKVYSIGVYPQVSLKEARQIREEIKRKIVAGIDPSYQKKVDKLTKRMSNDNSFEKVAREWFELQKARWTPRHASYVVKRMEADIFPIIGFRAISEITPPELLVAVKEIEKRGAIDIAHRALQTSGQVFRYAVATGRAERDMSSDLRGALTPLKKQHYNRLRENELPEFLQKLEEYDGNYDGESQTRLALKLLVATFVRTNELIGAKWKEFDLVKAQWRIPAQRMKMREEHIVPLSKQTLEIVENIAKINGGYEFLFPGSGKPYKPISNNTMLFALYRMGYRGRATTHGFRATASTILNENGFRADVIERQLAHGERNKVRASYNHAQYLPERIEMMQWWADHLDKLLIK